jgi:hypothetical protein
MEIITGQPFESKGKKPGNNFTIITGSGRCGTTALMKFMEETKIFHTVVSPFFKKMRAGLEHDAAVQANSLCSKEVIKGYEKRRHNNLKEGTDLIKKIVRTTEIVKTPTFFFYNSYKYWRKAVPQEDLQVFLLKRDNPENVLKSAVSVNNREDWGLFKTGDEIEEHYKLNVQTLLNLNIPIIELEFPKFVLDPIYLFNKLKQYKPISNQKNFNLDLVIKLSEKVFDKSLITIK